MPKLWSATIEQHRSAVFDAILDATGHLVHRQGVSGLTMTALAESAGVGRATLYKYVPDCGAAIAAWQQREMARHLSKLRAVAEASPAETRLDDVLEAYARIRHHRHGRSDMDDLHGADRVAPAEAELRELVGGIITEDAAAGRARMDIPTGELAAYAVAAVAAVYALPDMAAGRRIVSLVVETIRRRDVAAPAPVGLSHQVQ